MNKKIKVRKENGEMERKETQKQRTREKELGRCVEKEGERETE